MFVKDFKPFIAFELSTGVGRLSNADVALRL